MEWTMEMTKTSNWSAGALRARAGCIAALREVFGEFEVGGAAGLSLGEITRTPRRAHSILRQV